MASAPLQILAPVSRGAAILVGWALMAISVATVVEILGRKLFGFTLAGVDEIGGYLLAATSALGFAWALTTRSHMRITLVLQWLPRGARAWLDVFAMVSLAAMALFCAWRGWTELAANLESGKRSNTPLQMPLWAPQAVWFAGLVLFAVASGAAAGHAVLLLFRDRARLEALYGPASLEEEVRTEVSQLETRLAAEAESGPDGPTPPNRPPAGGGDPRPPSGGGQGGAAR